MSLKIFKKKANKMETKKETRNDLIKFLKSVDTYVKADVIIKVIPELKNAGILRETINYLRTTNHPIISSSKGYKWSEDKREILDCILDLKHRIEKQNNAIQGLFEYCIEKQDNKDENEN